MKCTCPNCGTEFEIESGPFTPLRAARQAQGLSLNKVSEKLGISIRALGRLERGIGNPRLSDARKISELYDASIETLFPITLEEASTEEYTEDDPTE